MNVLIIYFSQTGGTEKIAKMIQQGILNSGNKCEIKKIKNVNPKNLNNFDLIGIGTPTFFHREPINVRIFIQNMKNVDEKHCFIFSTHSSLMGNTFYYMFEQLTKKGFVVIGSFDSYSECSFQIYPKIMHTAKHPDNIELEEAKDFGEKICNISLRIQNGESNLIPKFELIENAWWAKLSKILTQDFLRKFYPEFIINREKCTKCLICQENCPADAIDVETDPPEIQKEGCIFCLFCEKLCPEGAIETDWTTIRRESKPYLKRYVKALKEAELQGKFRPYVDYEKII
ncbi:MAG: EFR1 family ferrodoxin [Promethearchaeota archaeon]